MEVFGIDIGVVTALSVFAMGIVQWFKLDIMPDWAVRLISLAVSFAMVGLYILVNPLPWNLIIVNGFAVFFMANGIWHGADQIGRSVSKL